MSETSHAGNDEYRAAGVDYDVLDAAKRTAVKAAWSTSRFLERRGGRALDESRGEPAFVFQVGNETLALVVECLGTKSSLCRAYADATGIDHFDAVGYDTVAAVVNDVVCVGALPLVVNAYFASGAPEWIGNSDRFESLVAGFRQACEASGATWGGGETPTLQGIIEPKEVDLAGAAIGRVPPGRNPILGAGLRPGDRIILVESTGIHTNGISLVRRLATALPGGLLTPLPSGRSLGEAALDRSAIYVDLVAEILATGVTPAYLTNVTGHGLRKLMRPSADLTYRITRLPPVPEVLAFLVDRAGLDVHAAYGTLNMGAGFAVYCRPSDVDILLDAIGRRGLAAIVAGSVEVGPRRVVIEPIDVTYSEDDLLLR